MSVCVPDTQGPLKSGVMSEWSGDSVVSAGPGPESGQGREGGPFSDHRPIRNAGWPLKAPELAVLPPESQIKRLTSLSPETIMCVILNRGTPVRGTLIPATWRAALPVEGRQLL